MKNTLFPLLTFLLLIFVNISNASAQQVNSKIQEVYGDQTQTLVINDAERLVFLTDLIENRIKVIESPIVNGSDKHTKLSTAALFNKYNSSLTRDLTCNPITFNALKYDLKFSSKNTEVYRIDNTDYLIIIQPQTTK